jgi:2-isopropylmalate synthase
MLKHAGTYEIMTPESVGWSTSNLVLGKHSGRAAFRDKLRSLGFDDLGENALEDAFARFKALADRKKVVYEDDISALVDETTVRGRDAIRLVSLEAHTGSRTPPSAQIELEVEGVICKASAGGDGAVDATFNAVRAVRPHEARLSLFHVQAVTEGTDAQARATVRLEQDGLIVDGQGSDTDTIVAAALAYIHALNKLAAKQKRAIPHNRHPPVGLGPIRGTQVEAG